MRLLHRFQVCLIFGSLFWIAGCGSGHTASDSGTSGTPDKIEVASLATSGDNVTSIGETEQLSAQAVWPNGDTTNISAQAHWSSSNIAVATVSSTGLVTIIGVGTATITATYNGESASVVVTGSAAEVHSLVISPATSSLPLGKTQQLIATGTYSDGTTRNATSHVTWTVGSSDVIAMDTSGVAHSVTRGTSTVTAAVGSVVAHANVTVGAPVIASVAITPNPAMIPLGANVQFTATATYSDGTTADISSSFMWNAAPANIVTINAAGLAHGVGRGAFTVSGTSGDDITDLTGVVSDPVAQHILVDPNSASVPRSANQPFRARAVLSDGSSRDISSAITWQSSNPSVATVNSSGIATAVAPGVTQITGSYLNSPSAHSTGAVRSAVVLSTPSIGQTFSSSAPMTVLSTTVSSLNINALATSIAKGTTVPFTAIATLSDGTSRDVTSDCAWTSSVPTVAAVSSAGVASGIIPGASTITGSYGGQNASVIFTVTPATLVSILVMPANPTIAVGGALQVHAIGTFSDGTTQDVSDILTYASSDTTVATVNNDGMIQALIPGTITIAASQGSAFVSFPITITSAIVLGLDVSAVAASIAKGTDLQFTASASLSDGTTQDVTHSAVWSSSASGIASIDATGIASALVIGNTTITAQYGGQSGSASLAVNAATLNAIVVTPAHPTIPVGGTLQLEADGAFSDGSQQDLTSSLIYMTSDPTIATVSSDGRVHFVAPGTVTITVKQGSVTRTFQVTASPATVTGLNLNGPSSTIAKGTSAQFTATALLSDSTMIDVTNSALWTTGSATIATIDNSGLATAVTPGAVTVSAMYGGQSASANLTVNTANLTSIGITPLLPFLTSGGTLQLHATGHFSDGSTQDVTDALTYASSNPAVVTVSSDGILHFVAPGTATITVSRGGVSFSFLVTSSGATVTTLTVTPAVRSVAKGLTTQFTASAVLSDSSTQDVTTSAVWNSSAQSVATVNSSGLAGGVTQGTSSITAQYGGQTGAAGLTVTSPTLVSVAVGPPSLSIPLGTAQQLTATAIYSDGSTGDITNFVTWSSSPTGVATIDASGMAHGISKAAFTATATSGAQNGHLTGAVVDPIASQIQINPASTSIARGSTHSFHASAVMSDGSVQDVTASTTWQSADTSIATIDNTGVATAFAIGTTQVSGSYQGLTSSASVVVTNATVSSLSVTPPAPSIAKGTTQQFSAIASLSDGSTQNITTSTAWSSSALSVATINTSGLATASAAGSSTVTGQYGGRSATANLTVTTATLASITISPSNPSVPSGGTLQLHATGTFSDSTIQDVTNSLTYLSSVPLTATVTSDGVIHAGIPGTTTITASKGTASKSFVVTITNATLGAITITPASATLVAGSNRQFTATGQYSDGSSDDLTSTVNWTSSSPSVASIDSQGKAAAAGAGTTVITATSGSTTGTTDLTVTPATVTAITVSPSTASIAAGQQQAFTATATLSDTTSQDVTTSTHWAVANSATATISNDPASSGVATGVAAGTTQVTAALGGINGTASLTVSAATLVSLAITPLNTSVAIGVPADLTAIGTYSDGSTVDLTDVAHWTNSNGGILSVLGGIITPISVGTSGVTATVGGQNASTNVTVTAATLGSIAITPSSLNLPVGLSAPLTAIGSFSNSSTQDVTPTVHWTSSPASVATVSNSGVVQGASPGSSIITATLGTVSQTLNMTVSSASLQSIAVTAPQTSFALGSNVQLTATGTYSDSSTQNLTNIAQWSSSAPAVGTVNSSGLASGVTAGSLTANATSQGVTGGLPMTTAAVTLVSITVTPSGSLLHTLGHQLTATGHYSDGSTQVLTTGVHWSVSNGLLTTITQGGNLFPLGLGTFTVHATVGAIDGQAVITLI
ncbi:MAG TPA: Ig-like domain-containing protein [Terriglobales bacterium]|nr:Ig-like domain-containing protein [Terriglobales bacterium]